MSGKVQSQVLEGAVLGDESRMWHQDGDQMH